MVPDQERYTYPPPTMTPATAALADGTRRRARPAARRSTRSGRRALAGARALGRIRAQLRRAAAELAALDARLHAAEVRSTDRPPQALTRRAPPPGPAAVEGPVPTMVDSVAPPGGLRRLPWATPGAAPVPAGPVGLVEPLTAREREVLARLGQRWSNKEIAAALQVSPETVKRHAATIYAKLGAGGRRAAAQRAAALGLLPPG